MNCPHCHREIPNAALLGDHLARARTKVRNPGRKRSKAPHCPCGAMTLKRATDRGRGAEHAPGCTFAW